jgi:quercetin dioxygenase-like cupin family protein
MSIIRNFPSNIAKALVVLSAVVAMTTVSNAAGLDNIQNLESVHDEQSVATPLSDAVRPSRTGVVVTPVSRVSDLHDHALSAFIVDYAPGGSAMLHRSPPSGYVLVHVLSGTIKAYAWQASVGTYHAGETWTEPAFAHSIATANASLHETARALVVIATEDRAFRDIAANDPR